MNQGSNVGLSASKQALLQALLQRRLQGEMATTAAPADLAISLVPREGTLPLSMGQQRLWFLDQWNAGSAAYHIPVAVRLRGALQPEALAQSLSEVVRRHEILRTRYLTQGSLPVQVIDPPGSFPLAQVDLAHLPADAREAELARQIQQQALVPFDLAAGPMLRATLIRLGELEHVLVLIIHHIAADGWSLGVLLREMGALYPAFAAGAESPLPALPIQYADYAAWQREQLQGPEMERQLAYWRERLQGAPTQLELFADRPRRPVMTARGRSLPFHLPPHLVRQVEALAAGEGATPFMVLLSAFQTLLYRHTGQEDLVVGSPVAGRSRTEVEGLIGFFVNTLALRTDLSGSPTFRGLLGRVRQTTLEAYSHQDLPFERLVEELDLGRDLSRTPLFQVMLALNNTPTAQAQFGGLTLEPLHVDTGTAKFDLTLELWTSPDGLRGRFDYSADLYDEATAAGLLAHFQRLLAAAVADPDQPIARLPMLAEAEEAELLSRWSAPALFADAPCLHQRFEQQAARLPEAIALSYGDEQISYGELNRRANRLAHYLQRQGVRADVPVALYLDRGPALVVAILAILKAGGAYLPLDPVYPRERVAFVLADTQAPVLLTQSDLRDRLPETPAQVVCLDQADWLAQESDQNPESGATPGNLAYIIYTSGSTGQPKGVLIEHRNVVRLFTATDPWFRFSSSDVWTLFHSYAFDFSVWELWGALLYGGRLVVVPYLVSRSPQAFYRLLAQERVTVLNQTPSAFRQLIRVDESAGDLAESLDLRLVIFGGEALELQSLKPWFDRHSDQRPQLVNMYGITETTVHVTYRPIALADLETPASVIGGPIPDLSLYVLDQHLQPVPVGVPGELHVGGAGLARGYLNRPELTAQRFVPNPHGPGRLYRSGDLARRLPNGDLEYLGRIDHQVKIRGHRIELGEIEAALNACPAVQEAVVLARADEPGEQRLVAYLVPRPGMTPTVMELRAFLTERLPEYMLPSHYVTLDSFPLTANGKLDRTALPAPSAGRAELGEAYVAPRTPAEALLCEIWATVLGLEQVGVHDNFFALGGDSIRAIQVLSMATERGLAFTLQQLFQRQSVAGLCEDLQLAEGPGVDLPPSQPFSAITRADRLLLPAGVVDAYPLTALQSGMLYHMEFTPDSQSYFNITSFKMRAPFDQACLEAAVQQVVNRHPVLRTGFDFTTYSEPLQLVYRTAVLPLGVADLRASDPAACDQAVAQWIAAEQGRRFDLACPPLLRLQVHRRTDEVFHFTISECHAILDGWSFTSIIQEIFQTYLDLVHGRTPQTAEPTAFAFRDFVLLERQVVQSVESRDFWLQKLSGATPTAIPRWQKGGDEQERRFQRLMHHAEPELLEGLRRVARLAAVPLKSVLLAAHMKVMSVLGGTPDVLTGLVANGRPETADGERVRGLFLNTVPMRLQVTPGSWIDLARAAFATEWEALPHRRYPLPAIQKAWGQAPFETSFNFVHFRPLAELVATGEAEILDLQELADTNFTFQAAFSILPMTGNLLLMLDANGAVVTQRQLEAMRDYYLKALTAMVASPESAHHELSLLSEVERQQLLYGWNETAADFPDCCLHPLFEAQAERTPDAVAVAAGPVRLTYRELNRRANRLAHQLQEWGVGPDSLVAICMERAPEMVVGVLGVLKAGGAYLPMDPDYPKERLAFMLADAAPAVLLTQRRLRPLLPEHQAQVVELDGYAEQAESGPACEATPQNLAYIIYTSGSTGRPKGVMIEHRGLVNYLTWATQTYAAAAGEGSPVHSSLAFDLTVTSLFTPLLTGRRVDLLPQAQRVEGLTEALQTGQNYSLVKITPAHLDVVSQTLPAEEAAGRTRAFIIGGEQLLGESLRFWQEHAPATRLINEYGPTETVVGCAVYELAPGERIDGPVPIGRPIANTQLYLLDEQMEPVPVGVTGELYIGGAGVARGYLNRPELTAERFVADPFRPGGRLYKTGDLARYRPDGQLEFLGRRDHQVKIRGFRIELGEIEAALTQHPGLREVVVIARQDRPGDRRLAAYLVPSAEPPTSAELRAFLAERLPAYMVPAHFVTLRALPLTTNGKVDRTALPAPQAHRADAGSHYTAPATPAEEILAEIWAQVLRLGRVSTVDNFFELGGDSILAFQVVSLAGRRGLRITPRQLFEQPTIAGLARVAEVTDVAATEEGEVTGAVPLTPIQHWFFQQALAEPHHYNQTFLFSGPADLRPEPLQEAVRALLAHHDALRMRFFAADGGPQQVNAAVGEGVPVEWVDLSGMAETEQRAAVEAAAARYQASLDLAEGPLVRVVLFQQGAGRPSQLLLVIHHLVVDGLSWRVLLDDLQTAYRQAAEGQPIQLPPKSASFKRWAERLLGYAQSEALRREIDHWASLAGAEPAPVPTDGPGGRNTVAENRLITLRLTAEESRQLLQEAPRAYHTQINDLLLTALVQAVGRPQLLVDLEGHGREELFEGIDLSRTVGWFTTLFPVLLDLSEAQGPGEAVKAVKEQLRRLPQKGIGYGLLRYLTQDEGVRAQMAALPQPAIRFNYLGQFDQGDGLFSQSAYSPGSAQSPLAPRSHQLGIDAAVVEGQLEVTWSYSAGLHRTETVQALAEGYMAALRRLIVHCLSPEAGGFTPSDFPRARLNQKDLDRFLAKLAQRRGGDQS